MRTELSEEASSGDEGGQGFKVPKNLGVSPDKLSPDDDEIVERPRSYSLPNLVLVPEPSMEYQF
jgi:hypothetical protein